MFLSSFRQFKMYLKQFKVFSFSLIFFPINFYLLKLFTPLKKIKLTNYQNDIKVIKLRSDNLITHFRSNLFFVKEKEVRLFIDKYLKNEKIFLDVGSNIGVFSMYAAIRKNAIVFALEPEYSNLALLKENIINNELTKNIYPFSLAVGKNLGITNLNIADTTPGAAVSTIAKNDILKTDEGYNVLWKEGVYEITLDKFCKNLNINPFMIKIDTDGNEENVLIGSEKILKNESLEFLIIEKTSNQTKLKNIYSIMYSNGFIEIEKNQTRNSFWKRKN